MAENIHRLWFNFGIINSANSAQSSNIYLIDHKNLFRSDQIIWQWRANCQGKVITTIYCCLILSGLQWKSSLAVRTLSLRECRITLLYPVEHLR